MTEYSTRNLDEFAVIARTWHHQRDNYGPGIQNMRASERFAGERLLRSAMDEHLSRRQELVLRVGNKTVEVVRFSPLPYGFSTMRIAECEPGTPLPLVWLA